MSKKWELLKEHENSWKSNGLSDLNFNDDMIINNILLAKNCIKITMNIGLNSTHWTNTECSLDFVNS